jgi:hypothetical protein
MKRKRKLHRRYGRMGVGSVVVHSRMSLSDYENMLRAALHSAGMRDVATADERMQCLDGWREGRKPTTVAVAIERQRLAKARARS